VRRRHLANLLMMLRAGGLVELYDDIGSLLGISAFQIPGEFRMSRERRARGEQQDKAESCSFIGSKLLRFTLVLRQEN